MLSASPICLSQAHNAWTTLGTLLLLTQIVSIFSLNFKIYNVVNVLFRISLIFWIATLFVMIGFNMWQF